MQGIKFCLVFPPYKESEDIFFLKTARNNLGKIPPLSLLAVAAILEKYGAEVKLIDANASGLSVDEVIQTAVEFSPDFLGFTLSTYQFHFTLEWIRKLRSKVDVPVIVGGPHARIYPREVLTHECIDYCVMGDAEDILPQLTYSLVEKKSLTEVGGIAYKNNEGDVKSNDFSLYIDSLDGAPFPSRHLSDNSLYYSLISKYKNFTAMTSSRGCVFQCTFCDNHCIPYRAMSPKRVVDEMEICKKDFAINEIDMFDGVFSVNKKRLLEVSDQIVKRKLKIYWSFRTRADLIDKETLTALKSAGCIRIYYGIESGSAKILKNIKKNVEIENIKYILKLTKGAGIDTFGYFMVGNYGETYETISETMDLMLSLPLDYIQIAPIFYPPNTEVYSDLMKVIKRDYWKDYTVDSELEMEFPIIGTDFNKSQIHSIVRKMYLRFYLRPKFIIKFIFSLKSFSQLARSVKAVFDMVRESVIDNSANKEF
ncbi:MAG: B12-binding domain-containing radical SAM protein [Candidatus Omnitrophica bacterium]|nr:B12-binding domain-containing radical SAM protein [Candidatus Omnitrophota bacterium]MBU1853431.1 B12-binding domain-containing radical SAM protein [Candidatus Omnitrophota bacterium]